MLVIVFSESSEGLKFFSEAVNSVKGKFGKNLKLILFSQDKPEAKADLVTDDFGTILQWSETTSERLASKGK